MPEKKNDRIQKILDKAMDALAELDSTEAYWKAMDIVGLYVDDEELAVDFGFYDEEDYRHTANRIAKCMY